MYSTCAEDEEKKTHSSKRFSVYILNDEMWRSNTFFRLLLKFKCVFSSSPIFLVSIVSRMAHCFTSPELDACIIENFCGMCWKLLLKLDRYNGLQRTMYANHVYSAHHIVPYHISDISVLRVVEKPYSQNNGCSAKQTSEWNVKSRKQGIHVIMVSKYDKQVYTQLNKSSFQLNSHIGSSQNNANSLFMFLLFVIWIGPELWMHVYVSYKMHVWKGGINLVHHE